MIDQKHLAGAVLRVYDPPRPIEEGYRDFDASKVDVAPDGSMLLSKIEATGEEVDFTTGRKAQGYKQTLLAVIDADGHLRAETIELAAPAAPRID